MPTYSAITIKEVQQPISTLRKAFLQDFGVINRVSSDISYFLPHQPKWKSNHKSDTPRSLVNLQQLVLKLD